MSLARDLADNEAAIQRLRSAVFALRAPCPSGGAVNEASRPKGRARCSRIWRALHIARALRVQTMEEIEAAHLRAALSPEIRAKLAW